MSIHDMKIDEHGGGCCGIIHLHEFPTGYQVPAAERDEFLKRQLQRVLDSRPTGGCDCGDCDYIEPGDFITGIECVLADVQMGVWAEVLEANGFKNVFSFHNSNSGNECNVFYLAQNA